MIEIKHVKDLKEILDNMMGTFENILEWMKTAEPILERSELIIGGKKLTEEEIKLNKSRSYLSMIANDEVQIIKNGDTNGKT